MSDTELLAIGVVAIITARELKGVKYFIVFNIRII
jgi:hypothetical protein